MKIVNLTPNVIHFISDNETGIITFPPSGVVASISFREEPANSIFGMRTVKTVFDSVLGLPPPDCDIYYIVDRNVLDAMPFRSDLISPENFLYNENDGILICRSFVSNAPQIGALSLKQAITISNFVYNEKTEPIGLSIYHEGRKILISLPPHNQSHQSGFIYDINKMIVGFVKLINDNKTDIQINGDIDILIDADFIYDVNNEKIGFVIFTHH